MAKKITVQMLKNPEAVSFKDLEEITETIKNNVKKMGDIKEEDLAPLDNIEEHLEFLTGIGVVFMALLKKSCTPAAWKYMLKNYMENFNN